MGFEGRDGLGAVILGWAVAALLGAYLALCVAGGQIRLRQGGFLRRDRRPGMFWFCIAMMGAGWGALVGVLIRTMVK